jgi:hypothetical protein
MAQKVQVLLVCDLHDTEVEGSEAITFGLDGQSYEIDVCADHAAQLRDTFAPFVGAGRRANRPSSTGGQRRGRGSSGRRRSGSDDRVGQIREWARSNGHQVSERGRLSASLVEAYEKANS